MEKDFKRVDKLFIENPNIEAGWLDLNVGGDIEIPVSYLNSRFFYDLLQIVSVLGTDYSFESGGLRLYVDCEGFSSWLTFSFFSEMSDTDSIYHTDYVAVTAEREMETLSGCNTVSYKYMITREDLIKNILTLVESNLSKYNKDFCCGDIATKITRKYLKTVKANLLPKF